MIVARWLALLVWSAALVACSREDAVLTEAVAAGRVEIASAQSGAGGTSATLVLRRGAVESGSIVVDIPAGTILYAAEHQRLIVAAPVRVELSDEREEVMQLVSTFCIDEFLPTPPEGVPVSLAPQGGFTGTEETEPLHKLANCLANLDLPYADKQLAVWAVAGNLMEKRRDEAVEFVASGLAERMAVERRNQLEARKPELMAKAPNLGAARIDQLIEAELEEGEAELRDVAQRKAQEQVDNFIDHDRWAMQECGYRVATLPLFQL